MRQAAKQASFYEETARVPMIFRGNGICRGRDLSGAPAGNAMPERE